MPERSTRAFLLLCVAAIGAAVAYISLTSGGGPASPEPGETGIQETPSSPTPATPLAAPLTQEPINTVGAASRVTTEGTRVASNGPGSRSRVMYRDTSLGRTHGRLVDEFLGEHSSRRITDLTCERVHFAAGNGVCLTAKRGFVTVYGAFTFDGAMKPRHQFSLAGVPSRVRVSPDGRRAGMTVFVSGDSYAPGSFSTRTTVIDTATGESLGDLEQYTVLRDGTPVKAADFNFWGITFAEQNRIYATLGTGGRTYLIEANVDARQATIRHENVECPSLSPDGTRIAFKKRMPSEGGRLLWRLHVLDLRTGLETALAESRSVDDQAEWLNTATVAYALPSESTPGSTDVWSVHADGSGSPTRTISAAWSPAFVRPGTTPAP
jgi:hypothetical protein